MPYKKKATESGYHVFDWPLNGKFRTDADPCLLGAGDFQNLTNLGYTNSGIRGRSGQTKVNTSATSYTSINNIFHFRKNFPYLSASEIENHIFAQTSSGSNSRLVKSDNTTSIPSQDTFSSWLTLSSADTVYFSNAPDSTMAAFDGTKNYIWSGNEYRCAQFINYNPDNSFWYDYTAKVNNTLTDDSNVATLKRVSASIDSNTKALWHLDDAVTDSSGNSHTLTNTNVTFSNSDYVFGGYSAVFNGTNAKLSIADHADFNYSGGTFTISKRVKVTSLAANNPIYYQNTTTDADSFKFYIDTNGAVRFQLKATVGGTLIDLATPNGTISTDTWYIVALVESGNNYYIFVGLTGGTATLLATTSSTDRAANYTGTIQIGYGLSGVTDEWFAGKMDEIRISNAARWTGPFQVPLTAYGSSTVTYAYIGAARPIQGVKFYIGTANASASTTAAYEWNGSGWSGLTILTDSTKDVGGTKTMTKTGSVTFASTETTSKVKIIRQAEAYYYLFAFTGIDDNVKVYYCTVDAPVQGIVDLWDGSPRTVGNFFYYNSSTYIDQTVNVLQADYNTDIPYTYARIELGTYRYLGFAERSQGFYVLMPDSTKVNATPAVISIDYWNGSTWVTVGDIDDGTSNSGITMAQSGSVTWQSLAENVEFTTTVGNTAQLYYYRISFSTSLTGDSRIDYIYGIPSQLTILPYRFPVVWQDRLWLCDEVNGERNTARCTAFQTVSVLNGSQTIKLYFGGADKLVAGSTMFSRFGNSLFDTMILFKQSEIWLVDGVTPQDFRVFQVSDAVGCVAPLTLQKCSIAYEMTAGLTKHVLIWEGQGGIYLFDGNAVTNISGDISDYFDPNLPNYIGTAVSSNSAFYDPIRLEYHWIFSAGEFAYDLLRKKWRPVDRNTKAIQCGTTVMDSLGNKYNYAGTSSGYIYRLENGTTFDGDSITYKFRTGDLPLSGSGMFEADLRYLKLTAKAKTTSTAKVTISIYEDGKLTASHTLRLVSQQKSGCRVYKTNRSFSSKAVFHSFEATVTTNDETIGFEPLILSGLFKVEREDIKEDGT